MRLEFKADSARCSRCGACALDCPVKIIKQEKGSLPSIAAELEESCLRCQHCLAICPTAAISILGLKPEDSLGLKPEDLPGFEQEERLLRGRRSVRHYRKESVKPELIDKLLAAIANSPTGCNAMDLTFTLIDGKADMDRFLEKAICSLEKAKKEGRIPEELGFLYGAVEAYRKDGVDLIFRGAPHALIVSSGEKATCPAEDVVIALSYFELLAQSAGLGTVWCGYLKFVLDAAPELKDLLGLPRKAQFYAILFGHPSVHYARTVQRDKAAEIRRAKF